MSAFPSIGPEAHRIAVISEPEELSRSVRGPDQTQRMIDPYTLEQEFHSVIGGKANRVNRLVTELRYSFHTPKELLD